MRKLLFSAACICSLTAHAQFNDSVHYQARIAANGNFSKTADGFTMLYNNGVKFNTRFERFHFNSAGSWIYGRNPQKVTNNDWNAVADFNVFARNRAFYYWGLFNFTSSYSLNVNRQFQSGAGLAYTIFHNKPFNIGLSNGLIHEFSNVYTSDNETIEYITLRNSFRLRINYAPNKRIKFSSVLLHQPSLDIKNDYIINGNATLEIKINKWVNLTTGFTYNKVSRTNKENMIFTYGVVAERFF